MTLKKLKIRLAAFGLAMVMGLLSVGNAAQVSAAEGAVGQKETAMQENPVQESVPVQRRVVAKNLTKSVKDRSFLVGTCLEGIQFDPEKDDVSFNKIIGDDGSEYQSGKAGIYTATYLVTPKDQSECYVVTRKITVTDTEGTAQVSENGGQKQKTDTEPEEDAGSKTDTESKENADLKPDEESTDDADSKKDNESTEDADSKKDDESQEDADLNKDDKSKEDTEPKDEGSKEDTDSKEDTETEGATQMTSKVKITVSGKGDAKELLARLMEDITGGKIMILSAAGSASESSSSTVSLDKGDTISDIENLKDYAINWFHINGRAAYCVPTQKTAKTTDDIPSMLDSNVNLQKALYYGYGGYGDLAGKYFSGKSEEEKYAYTHIAVNYAYAGEAELSKEELESAGVMAYIDFLFGQENPPSRKLSLSNTSVDAILDGDIQKTPEIQLEGDSRVSVKLNVPEDVTCYNVKRKESITNGDIQIHGGDFFYFSAKGNVTGQYDSGDLYGSADGDWSVTALAADGKQGIAVSEYPSAEPVRFCVNWSGQMNPTMKISLLKKDKDTDQPLAGAVYGIYKEHQCDELLMELPATDEDGKTVSDPIDAGSKQVYLKEIQAPENYLLDSNVYPVDV